MMVCNTKATKSGSDVRESLRALHVLSRTAQGNRRRLGVILLPLSPDSLSYINKCCNTSDFGIFL